MKRVVLLFSMLSLCASAATAGSPAPSTSLRFVAGITNAQAAKHLPVSFEATVIYYRSYGRELFVQDEDAAIYIYDPRDLHLVPGDRVRVNGTTRESFRPYVMSSDVTVVSHGALPKPIPATFEQMIKGEIDCRLVTVRALIRSADIVPGANAPFPGIRIRALVDGGNVDVDVDDTDETKLKGLLDAEVELTGATSGHFDSKMQQTGILLHVQTMNDVKTLKRTDTDPWSLPITPMDRVIIGYRAVDQTERMRVRGTLIYYQQGVAMVLQDGNRSLWISTGSYQPLRLGDLVEATGFPDVKNGFLTLTRAEVRDTLISAPAAPALFTWQDLASGGNRSRGHGFDLVTIEGQVVAEVREATQDGYVLSADGHLVSAIFSHPGTPWGQSSVPLVPMKELPVGTKVRVTGICILSNPNPFAESGEVAFDIYLRSLNDISVVARPPWLNVAHLLYLVGLLVLAILVIGVRGWFFEHSLRRQTVALAQVERRRSQILEEMNISRPLESVLDQIAALVSFKLQGAPCWCTTTCVEVAGTRPPELASSSWRIVDREIASPNGPALGKISAALVGRRSSDAVAQEALAMGAELATLAIETSRLHSDLVHRSEFDMLTDVANRFSFEKGLKALVDAAHLSGAIFGLIFMDLDRFKEVNDQYGHQAGDLYLQQAAQRMKRQLRSGDTLARLGGDEFAVVVTSASNRAEIDEIALRLERCFHDPFTLEGHLVIGSASVGIALYPEDADSADSLLSKADSAMYLVKQARHNGDPVPDGGPGSKLAHCA